MIVLYVIIGLVMLVGGAELLVRGGSHVAIAAKVPILVVGLTLVAFGTSTPELAVSVTAANTPHGEMALANVNGSNVANILLVLGLAAVVRPLAVDRRLMRREVPSLLALQLAVPIVCTDGVITRWEGAALLMGGVVYNVWLLADAMAQRNAYVPDDDLDVDVKSINLPLDIAMLAGGIVILLIGADFFVEGAEGLALWAGLSPWFIGLTVVAVGTSMPELMTSVVASYKGEVELALGNALGSNILNVALVLGISAMVNPIHIPEGGVDFDNFVAVGVALLLIPIVLNGRGELARVHGVLMVAAYATYIAFIPR